MNAIGPVTAIGTRLRHLDVMKPPYPVCPHDQPDLEAGCSGRAVEEW